MMLISLFQKSAVDDDNPVGEVHQHLEETFDDLITSTGLTLH